MYRKACLQHFAIPVEKPRTLGMMNWVKSAGGPTFMDIIRHVARDGRGLEIMLDILRLSAFRQTRTMLCAVCHAHMHAHTRLS